MLRASVKVECSFTTFTTQLSESVTWPYMLVGLVYEHALSTVINNNNTQNDMAMNVLHHHLLIRITFVPYMTSFY